MKIWVWSLSHQSITPSEDSCVLREPRISCSRPATSSDLQRPVATSSDQTSPGFALSDELSAFSSLFHRCENQFGANSSEMHRIRIHLRHSYVFSGRGKTSLNLLSYSNKPVLTNDRS
ncbi:hypothetical protein QL285_079671 [Trifolium repens]|nr:hypothetical protein QL285_079671 [Trifolium repens]